MAIQPKILEKCVEEAQHDRTWAEGALQDEAWLRNACEYSIETALCYALTPDSELALNRYHYWYLRATSTYAPYGNTANLQPTDALARTRWFAAGGILP